MNPVRIAAILGAAFVASIGAALFAHSLAAGKPQPKQLIINAPAEKPMARVLVAKHDLQPGDQLTSGDFTWQPWPMEGLNPAFVVDGQTVAPQASMQVKVMNVAATTTRETLAGGAPGAAAPFVGAIVREPMLQGEPIVAKKVVRATDAGVMAVSLAPGMRAMAVPLSAESAAGGFILPGDHVDVVQSRKVDGLNGLSKYASGAVLRNVKVMAIDQQSKALGKLATQIGATATLEVTPEQAELLALSKSQGELTLILRSYADIAGPASAGGGPRVSQTATVAPTVVKVFRNGAPAEVMVSR